MALSCFPKLGGGVESIVTSINGYFLVPVSEMDVYIVFLYFSGFSGLFGYCYCFVFVFCF